MYTWKTKTRRPSCNEQNALNKVQSPQEYGRMIESRSVKVQHNHTKAVPFVSAKLQFCFLSFFLTLAQHGAVKICGEGRGQNISFIQYQCMTSYFRRVVKSYATTSRSTSLSYSSRAVFMADFRFSSPEVLPCPNLHLNPINSGLFQEICAQQYMQEKLQHDSIIQHISRNLLTDILRPHSVTVVLTRLPA